MDTEDELRQINREQNARIDAVVQRFEKALAARVSRAAVRTMAVLDRSLTRDETGAIVRSADNLKQLRSAGEIFRNSLAELGADELFTATVNKFREQFGFFDRTLQALNLPAIHWQPADRRAFGEQLSASLDQLRSTVDAAAEEAKRKALFAAGGLRRGELAEELARAFHKTAPAAAQLADTAMTVFYRQVSARGFEEVQNNTREALQYRFYGPDDKITRPFCRRLLESGRTYTRREIDAMSNGQLPHVFVTGGGYQCRHQWVLAEQEADHEPWRKASRAGVTARRERDLDSRAIHALWGDDDPTDDVVAADQKRRIVSDLARRVADVPGLERLAPKRWARHRASNATEAAVDRYLAAWANPDQDSRLYAAMQNAIDAEFGLRTRFRGESAPPGAGDFYREHEVALRALARGQYEATQEWFAKQGIRRVWVFRGMSAHPGALIRAKHAREGFGVAEVELQPASSFSLNYYTSYMFAQGGPRGVVLGTEMPVERILATARTGVGSLAEAEVTALAGPGRYFLQYWWDGAIPPLDQAPRAFLRNLRRWVAGREPIETGKLQIEAQNKPKGRP